MVFSRTTRSTRFRMQGYNMFAVFKPSVRTSPSCGTQFSAKNRCGTIGKLAALHTSPSDAAAVVLWRADAHVGVSRGTIIPVQTWGGRRRGTDWGEALIRCGTTCHSVTATGAEGGVLPAENRAGCGRYPVRVRTWNFFRRSPSSFTWIVRQPRFGFCWG